MAGYKQDFGGNVDYAYGRGVKDLTSQLQGGMAGIAGAGKSLGAFIGQAQAARRGIQDMTSAIDGFKRDLKDATDPREIRNLTRQLNEAKKAAKGFGQQLGQVKFSAMEKGVGNVVKGLLTLNTSILSMSFNFLIDSIKRVYDLQEKWTRAIGGFNMKLGGMTKGIQGARVAATQWSSTIRGLTNGDINEGIEMFGDFTMAIGRTVKAGDQLSKVGLQIARGFGVNGQGAGQLLKVWENIGMGADDASESMKTSIKAANAAGIPVNMLADDLVKSSTYMARFGKEGQKTLIQGAAWARKYDISLEQLRTTVEGFDMFDDAAKSASKLNTAFGTMINSMDLMMEDDPAKRLDMIRQQMLAQGMTYDKLTPKQRRYFSETMKLSEEQTAALLDSKNANESYTDFQAKAAKKEKGELDAKKMMQKQLQATAQTMYAFGMAFDRVTVAIGKAIRPLLEVLGLAKKGGKDFNSFGGVMESITKTVVEFFESLSRNKDWNAFMIELAKDLQRAGTALKDFVMSGRAAKLVGDIAVGMKKFYEWVRDAGIMAGKVLKPLIPIFITLTKHLDKLAIAWGALKVFNFARGLGLGGGSAGGGGAQSYGGMFQGLEVGSTKTGSRFAPTTRGALGRGAMGMAGGLAAGMSMGGTGAMAGGAIGGAIGAFVPIIGPLLGPLGAALGKGIESLFKGGKSRLEKAQDRLADVTKRAADSTALLEKFQTAGEARRAAGDAQREFVDKKLLMLRKGQVDLAGPERDAVIGRIQQLQGFGKNAQGVSDALRQVQTNGKLTPQMLKALNDASQDYDLKLGALRKSTDAMNQAAMTSLDLAGAQNNQKVTELKLQQSDMDIQKLNDERDRVLTQIKAKGGKDNWAKVMIEYEKTRGQFNKQIEDKKLQKIEMQRKLQEDTLDVNKKMLTAELRRQALSSDEFLQFKEQTKNLPGMSMMSEGSIADMFLKTRQKDVMGLLGLQGESGSQMYSDMLGQSTPSVKLARGGVVTRPTRALIGEAGPEAVVPLKNYAGGGSGVPAMGGTTIVELNVDGQKLARAVVKNAIRGRN